MAKKPIKRVPSRSTDVPPSTDRVTYRELRNTPGRVFERLASEETLTLVAEGVPKALVIPINDGDVETALEAYRRGRALLAMNRIQAKARMSGTNALSLAEINQMIRQVREELQGVDAD